MSVHEFMTLVRHTHIQQQTHRWARQYKAKQKSRRVHNRALHQRLRRRGNGKSGR